MKLPHFFSGKTEQTDLIPEKQENPFGFWLDIALNLVIIIGLVFLIRTYVISPFQVYGPSMCDTLNAVDGVCQKGYGEYLIVNKFGYQNFFGLKMGEPQRGDIIVFHPPHNDAEFFIKRIIGLPGETVELKDGYVYVKNDLYPQGIRLEEDYLNGENLGNTRPMGGPSVFEIPDGAYLAFGDNRSKSSDARSCFAENYGQGKCGEGENTPYLTLDHIEGKAMLILWPLDKISLVKAPEYSLAGI